MFGMMAPGTSYYTAWLIASLVPGAGDVAIFDAELNALTGRG